MLAKAIALTAQAFEKKKDKGGQPYILHCLRVMNKVNPHDEELMCIAVLHDLMEDFPEFTIYDLQSKYGFSDRVIGALHLLNHKKEVSYDDYIKAIALNKDATIVKLADLEDNSKITRLKGLTKKDFDRMEKYHRSFIYLSKI